jgi:hypothetical protein
MYLPRSALIAVLDGHTAENIKEVNYVLMQLQVKCKTEG